jgi:glycosyltransferase involved in cell wall biosynthesis
LDVSVLLATRNRGALLRDTLSTLTRLAASGLTWEVIAVDNGSTDDTAAVLAQLTSQLPLVALHEPRPGKNVALNRALELARGELLLFTDDDVLADPDWLREHVRAARDWPAASVFAGAITPLFPAETPERVREHEPIRNLLCNFALPQEEGLTDTLPLGPNFSVRASAMKGLRYEEAIGPRQGGNFAMGSETELLKRLRDRGDQIVYVPTARVEHVVQPYQTEIDWLLGRSFRLGRGLTRMGFVYAEPAARIFGVPTYMWREIARTHVYYALGRFFAWPATFDIASEYHFVRGAIHEQRLMAREQRERGERSAA